MSREGVTGGLGRSWGLTVGGGGGFDQTSRTRVCAPHRSACCLSESLKSD